MMPIDMAKDWYNDFVNFSKSILKQDLDYGIIPGTPKPSLYKPGAEKLRFVYGLSTEMKCVEHTVDIDRPFIDYTYQCTVKSKLGLVLAQCEGSCNSMETKYGYVWKTITELPEGVDISKAPTRTQGRKITEFSFAVEKRETSGKYGKPIEYWNMWEEAVESGRAKLIKKKDSKQVERPAWELDETVTQYRVANPDVMNFKNTIMKMAQKRAFVGAVLIATGASEFFTQDIEDMDLHGNHDATPTEPRDFVEDTFFEEQTPPQTPATHQEPATKKQTTLFTDEEQDVLDQWTAKLKAECNSPEEVDELCAKNLAAINKAKGLRQLFVNYKHELRKKTA